MFNRHLSLKLFLFLGTLATAFGQTSFLLQEPGPLSTGGSFVAYPENANPLNPFATTTGPVGFGYAIAKPSGTGFYLIAPGAIESMDGAFATAPRIISGLNGTPTAATLTPDGTMLLVGVTDSSNNGLLYFVNTTTDQIIGAGIPLSSPPNFVPGTTGFCPACFIAVSGDSKVAYVLTNSGIGSVLTSINLSTRQTINRLVLFGGATSVTLSPQGLLYVTAVNVIYEITPSTLAITAGGTISIFFTPYRLHFTPDGTTAYAVNLVPTSGGSLIQLTVATHQTIAWPPFQQGVTPTTFNDVIVAGNNRIFAYDSADNALADVTANPFAATPSTLSIGPNNTQLQILAVAATNELPNASYLFTLVANGNQTNLYRTNLTTNAISAENSNVPVYPLMQVVTIPRQNSAASFLTFNTNQVLNTGGAAATLMAQVLDASGLPVFNAQATFTTDPTNGAVISNASSVTNANGYVQASVTVPNTPGTYNITLTVNAVNTIFTITVPGSSTVGPNGVSQVSIVTGEGQLVLQNSSSPLPLTILVTDVNGLPLANVPVTFAITSGAGNLSTPQTTTDSNGMASSFFTGLQLQINSTLLPVTVNASTQYGSVDFHETIITISLVDGSGIPQINILAPSFESSRTIVAPQGTPLPNAIVVQIFATLFPQTGQPIPNVAIYTYNSIDSTQPPPAVCQGSTNSDATGTARCTIVAACQIGTYQLGVSFGNPFLSTIFPIQIVAGGPTQFNFVSGNNQSGIAGATLNPLTATLTDGCGAAVPINTPVVWTITGGSATLVNTISKTDSQGRVSTQVKLGQTPGAVTVTVTAGTITKTFTLTNSIVVAGITLVSGIPQPVQTGQPFPTPLVFLVKDVNGNPVTGITVNFAVAGSGTVNPSSATTDANGHVQTTVTAGSLPGSIVVTATAAGFSATATLTSKLPGPSVGSTSFTNAASGAIGLVPCGLGIVVGQGIAASISGVVTPLTLFGPLPFTLAGFSMTVNGVQAPIAAVSNENGVQQVNFQTPCEVTTGLATVIVTVNGSSTTVSNVPVLAVQPGIFTFQGVNGKVYGAVFRAADGSYVTPTNFARRGETYYVVVTGIGQTTPALTTDSAGVPNQNVALQTVVGVNNAGVPVVSAQYAEGQIGVYLIGFQIPLTAPTGPDQSLQVGVIQTNGQTILNNQGILIPGVQ